MKKTYKVKPITGSDYVDGFITKEKQALATEHRIIEDRQKLQLLTLGKTQREAVWQAKQAYLIKKCRRSNSRVGIWWINSQGG